MLFQNIYNDIVSDKYSILVDEQKQLHFCYWYQHFKQGHSTWELDQVFDITQKPTSELKHNYRGILIADMSLSSAQLPNLTQYRNQQFSQHELNTILANESTEPKVFIDCSFGNLHIEQLALNNQLAFLNCQFHGNARFIECHFTQDIFFSNCTFEKHFSLKNSTVSGSVHLEGANFSGKGGTSFRGITVNNLYLDFSVKGPNDVTWLNEMNVSGVLSIGGTFGSEIELLTDQDGTGHANNHKIGSLYIGRDLYHSEHCNRTEINNRLSIQGYQFTDNLHITRTTSNIIELKDLKTEHLVLHDIESTKDIIVEQCHLAGERCFDLTESSIGRHLKIHNNHLNGYIDFSGSAVSENSYLENNEFQLVSKLDLRKFTTSRFLIEPADSLYNGASPKLLSPKVFSLVEVDTEKNGQSNIYASLKHWLADAGKLDLEDTAFFHMRDNQPHSQSAKWLLGRVFGWGIRLTNIAVFSLSIIMLFALLYGQLIPNITISKALALSFQSFISSFFGNWQSFDPSGMISTMVTLESIIGVLFITIFVGAYIRKLLR